MVNQYRFYQKTIYISDIFFIYRVYSIVEMDPLYETHDVDAAARLSEYGY